MVSVTVFHCFSKTFKGFQRLSKGYNFITLYCLLSYCRCVVHQTALLFIFSSIIGYKIIGNNNPKITYNHHTYITTLNLWWIVVKFPYKNGMPDGERLRVLRRMKSLSMSTDWLVVYWLVVYWFKIQDRLVLGNHRKS